MLLSAASAAVTNYSIDHSTGFSDTSDLGAPNGTATFTGSTGTPPNALQLTPAQKNGEAGSDWSAAAVGIDTFDTTFDFTYGSRAAPDADGFTFTLQNAPTGSAALGDAGSGFGWATGVTNSLALKFDLYDGNPGNAIGGPLTASNTYNATGLYLNGVFPAPGTGDDPRVGVSSTPAPIGTSVDLKTTSSLQPTGIDFHANPADTFRVHLVYDATTLTETVTDVNKNVSVTQPYKIDIPALLQSQTAFAGFTGSDGGARAEQTILAWKYVGTSGSKTVKLNAPALAASGTANPGEVNLFWNDVTNENGFDLESSSDGGATFTSLGMLPQGTTTFNITGLSPTGSYQYRIKALGNGADISDSDFSPVTTITPTGPTGNPIDHTAGFAGANPDLQLNGASFSGAPANALRVTDGNDSEAHSAFTRNQVTVSQFDTTFTWSYDSVPPIADGYTFTIQGDARGAAAVGLSGGALGFNAIGNSVAIKFDIYDGNTPNNQASTTGVFTGGGGILDGTAALDPTTPAMPGTSIDLTMSTAGPTGIDFHAHPTDTYQCHLVYDGTTLTETVTDLSSGATVTQKYTVDIPGTVMGNTAYVGFTGGTGGRAAEQDILTWRYSTVIGGAANDVINGTSGNDAITLKKDGSNIDWTMGSQSGQLPINDPAGLTINGAGGSDTITLDSSNGSPMPKLLTLKQNTGGSYTVNNFTSSTIGSGQKVDVTNATVTLNGSFSPFAVQLLLKGGQIFSTNANSNAHAAIADVDTASGVKLSYALKGDATLDNKVDFSDLLTVARHYGSAGADWSMGDFTYDAKVDFSDLLIVARNYGTTGAPTAVAAVNAAASLNPVSSSDTLHKSASKPLVVRTQVAGHRCS